MGHCFCEGKQTSHSTLDGGVVLDSKRMGRKDSSAARIPVEQYRKQIGKQDYKKSRPVLRATRLKAEAKKTALGIKGISVHRALQWCNCTDTAASQQHIW
ncbi:triple QxxK/R motif-containing protein isoform X3 [Mauremys reevesii]|uniref:triple QxxK/R motif-containing protein isoform X3 n=1 Tax=Mauremys reevesii TaxID=260615 RepID=UPI00193F84EB|nr:triple QxxK/R motif-containing protein isoform X3 [Mauremys reevesii]